MRVQIMRHAKPVPLWKRMWRNTVSTLELIDNIIAFGLDGALRRMAEDKRHVRCPRTRREELRRLGPSQ
jgi:hypothetical protein